MKLAQLVTQLAEKYKLSLFLFVSQETDMKKVVDGDEVNISAAVCTSAGMTASSSEAMGAVMAEEKGDIGRAVFAGFMKTQLKEALGGSKTETIELKTDPEKPSTTVH